MPEVDAEGFVHYTSPDAPKLRVMSPTGVIQFNNGIFKTKDEDQVQFLEKCLDEGGDLGRYVKRVQFQTAERIARAHQESQLAKEQVAKGATSTGHLAHEAQKGHERVTDMQQAGLTEDQAAKVAEEMAESENLVLTKKVDQSAAITAAMEDEANTKNPPNPEATEQPTEKPNSITALLNTGK